VSAAVTAIGPSRLSLDTALLQIMRLLLLASVFFWIVFLLTPLIVTVSASFTNTEFPMFPPRGLTLRWFQQVVGTQWFKSSLATSAVVASISTLFSLLLGLLAARALARRRFAGRSMLEYLVMGPLIIPSVVIGFALFNLALRLGMQDYSLLNIVIGHVVVTVPFTMRSIGTSMASLDASIEEAALSLGATPFSAFWRVTLPAIAPGVAAGAIIAFTFSFNDVTVAAFLIGPTTRTLAVELMSQMEYLPDPSPAAASTIVMLLTLGFFILIDRTVGLDVFARK
jgi:putative spermidine/putrescine transport system permease protein